MTTQTITDDLHLLIATLPTPLQDALQKLPQENLLEIVLDLGMGYATTSYSGNGLVVLEAVEDVKTQAEDVGRVIAQKGGVLFCGGLGSVMEFAAKGAKMNNGSL